MDHCRAAGPGWFRRLIRICFHGVESTGKSVLAQRLEAEHGWLCVPEFGRAYCERLFAEQGSMDLTMADLLAIAEGQDAAMKQASAENLPVLLLDTDPLMTAAWAEMLFGEVPEVLMAYEKADLYLLFAPDVPWVADGSRFFGTVELRSRFASVAEAMLARAGVTFERISGDWAERERQVVEAVKQALGPSP